MFRTPGRKQSAGRRANEPAGRTTPTPRGPRTTRRLSRTRRVRGPAPAATGGLVGRCRAVHRDEVAVLRLPLAVYGYFARQWQDDLTTGGKALVWCIALSGVGTVSVQMPLYQAFCALVMLLAGASGACSLLRPRVDMAHALPPRATAGGRVEGTVTLTNRRRLLPAFDVCVGFYDLPDGFAEVPGAGRLPVPAGGGDGDGPPSNSARCAAAGTRCRRCGRGARSPSTSAAAVRAKARRRGACWCGRRSRRWRTSRSPAAAGGATAGRDAGTRAGESPEFLGNRELLPGEHARRLDVRAWARTGKPVVRQFREEHPAGVAVLLDPRIDGADPAERAERFEAAVSRAAAVADAVGRGGGALALFADGAAVRRFRPGDARGAADAVLDDLALTRPVFPDEPAPGHPAAADPFAGGELWGGLADVSAVALVSAGPPDAGLVKRLSAGGRRVLAVSATGGDLVIRELAASRAPSSPPGPTPPGSRRVAFAALVLLQAALFGGMSRTLILPVLAGAAALFSLRTRERGRLSRLQFILAVGGIGAACLALWRLFPHRRPAADIDPELSAFGHALGQWALATQAALLNLDWGRDARGNPRLPVAAPLVGIPVLLTAGDIKATETERVLFLLGSVAFALLCGAFFAAGRREGRRGPAAGAWPRRAVLAAVTLAVAGSTWGASATLRRYERTMDRVIRQFLQPEPLGVSAGFTGQTTLDDVRKRKAYASDEVALRVDAGAAPGYLRGRAFYTLEIGDAVTSNVTKWIGGEEESRRRAAANLPPTTPLRVRRGDPTDETKTAFVFDFRRPPAERTAEELRDAGSVFTPFDPQPGAIDVWPASSFRGVVFAPPRTTRLLAPQPVIDADEYGLTILTPVGLPHYVCEPRANRGPKWERVAVSVDPADPRCTDVPAVFADDEDLAALADRVFAGRKTPAGRIAAAESYFRRNHRYQFGADLGTTGNPLRAFLLGRRAAHCEFFATAAAVMLRTRGVPTRYVTGFVAAESNPVGGYWVARNEDAHAWCEAWDPARGWGTRGGHAARRGSRGRGRARRSGSSGTPSPPPSPGGGRRTRSAAGGGRRGRSGGGSCRRRACRSSAAC